MAMDSRRTIMVRDFAVHRCQRHSMENWCAHVGRNWGGWGSKVGGRGESRIAGGDIPFFAIATTGCGCSGVGAAVSGREVRVEERRQFFGVGMQPITTHRIPDNSAPPSRSAQFMTIQCFGVSFPIDSFYIVLAHF